MPTPQDRPQDAARTRDEDLKPGVPPRPATEPSHAEGSQATDKTMTDPATGQPTDRPPAPNQADQR